MHTRLLRFPVPTTGATVPPSSTGLNNLSNPVSRFPRVSSSPLSQLNFSSQSIPETYKVYLCGRCTGHSCPILFLIPIPHLRCSILL